MGLIGTSFLGRRGLPCSHAGYGLFPLRLEVTQVSEGLALVNANYYNVYLGFVTHFGSPGTSPGILAPWVGQGGAQIPFYVLRQVSNYLDLLDVHSTDIFEGNRAHVGPFMRFFDPLLGG